MNQNLRSNEAAAQHGSGSALTAFLFGVGVSAAALALYQKRRETSDRRPADPMKRCEVAAEELERRLAFLH